MTKFSNSVFTPNFSYTYPGKLNTEILKRPVLGTPAISDFYGKVIQGVRCGEYMNILQPLSSVLQKGSTTCEPVYTQGGSITDRKLDTAVFEIARSWCKKEFIATCNVLGDSDLIGDGLDGYELAGRLRSIFFESILDTANLDFWKISFFGQTAHLGSSVYSAIDGIWTKYLDAFASYCVKTVENRLPNGATSNLNPDQARDTFRLLYEGAPRLLRSQPKARTAIYVTQSMYDNYLKSVQTNCCVEGAWKAGQDGIEDLRFNGIKVIPLMFADEALEESGNPYYNILRHFAIYTMPENNVVGFERAADLNNLELCYNCQTRTSYIQGEMRFGVQFVHCDLTTIAY
jgi:hypothetical protein